MKKVLFVLIASFTTISLFAQSETSTFKKFYADGGGGLSSYQGGFGTFGVTAVLKNDWIASMSSYSFDINLKNLPSNYQQGYTIFIIFPIPDAMPSQKLKLVNLTAGKLFQCGRKTWFSTEGGLSIVSGKKFSFTSQEIKSDWFYTSSNYSIKEESTTTAGLMLKSNFTWACTPYCGFSIGAFANLNSIQSPVGAEFKLIAGWLNTKRKFR